MEDKLNEFYNFLDEQQNKLAELINFDYQYITDVVFEDIDYNDYPDFCDCFISSAKYHDLELTDKLLDKLNEDRDLVYELLMDHLY